MENFLESTESEVAEASSKGENLSNKQIHILDCALKLLIEKGDAGLTLRKLADAAGMRLSNVQYYFKTKDDVLIAMVGRYFDECTSSLVALTERSGAETERERLEFVIRSGLEHGHEVSDMCRAFRELWAISSRNAVIDKCLMAYYQRFADILADYALGSDADRTKRQQVASLLIPYFEGYSVTGRAVPFDTDAATRMLTELTLTILEDNS